MSLHPVDTLAVLGVVAHHHGLPERLHTMQAAVVGVLMATQAVLVLVWGVKVAAVMAVLQTVAHLRQAQLIRVVVAAVRILKTPHQVILLPQQAAQAWSFFLYPQQTTQAQPQAHPQSPRLAQTQL